MATPQKIEKLKQQGRILWPKYDPDLDTQINGRARIHDYINHTFTACNLQDDLAHLKKQRKVDDLIDKVAEKSAKTQGDISWKPKDPNVSLNQAQNFNVIEELYGIDTTKSKVKGGVSSIIGKKGKAQKGGQQPYVPSSIQVAGPQGDYADYYKRIKEMAKDKGMKDPDMQLLLKNRQRGELEYKQWKLQKDRKIKSGVAEVNDASERLYALAEQRRLKQERTAKEKEEFEAEEIDNLAHIHADKHIIQDNVRSIEQFMQDQIHYEQRKLARLKEVAHKQELLNLKTHHPRINVTSQRIVEVKRSGTSEFGDSVGVYENSIVKKQVRREDYLREQDKNLEFNPQISERSKQLHRNFNTILEDTHRRQQQRQAQEANLKKKSALPKVQINSLSDKMVHDRFDADFQRACYELEIVHQPEDADTYKPEVKIGCAQMSQLFLKLGFVSPVAQEQEQLMLADIWKSIGGDHEGQGQIPLGNCKNLLRAIQNFHHQDIMDLEREHTSHIDTMNVGRETDAGLLFTSEEIEFITRKYIDLYSNRQDKLALDKKESHLMRAFQKQNYGEQYSYHPQVLRKSNQLFEQRKSQIKGQNGFSPLRVEQRLAMQKTEYLTRQQQRLAENEEVMMRQTPFQPNKDKRKPGGGPLTARHREQESMFENKWEFLHADSVRKTKTAKNDLSKDDIDYMRQPHEFTFHPNKDKTGGRNYETMKTDSSSPRRYNKKQGSSPRRKDSPSNEQFQINVNIGATRKTIIASMRSDPATTATKFMKQNNLDDKFHKTLTDLISEQQRQIREGEVNA